MTEDQFEVLKNWIETRVALTIKANQHKQHSEIVAECLQGIQAVDQSAKSHLVAKPKTLGEAYAAGDPAVVAELDAIMDSKKSK